MELKIKPYEQPKVIEFNFEELKQELEQRCKMYETVVYTESMIKEAKADRANLNRMKKAINDERIRREKEYNAPFAEFKAKVAEILEIIDRPAAIIDRQVKEYEEAQKKQKAEDIKAWFEANRKELNIPTWLEVGKIARPQWANASVTIKSIQDEIAEAVKTIRSDMEVVSALPEFTFEAMDVYTKTLDLAAAIKEGNRLSDLKKRKEEAEAARKAAEERARLEEEARKAAQDAQKAQEAAKQPEVEQVPTEAQKTDSGATESHTEANETKPAARWVAFEAFLTTDEAFALRDYLKLRGIAFRAPQKKEG